MLPLPRPARVVVREGKTWPGEGAGGASGRRRTGFSIFGSPSLLHAAGIPVRSAGEEAWHRARLAASRARQPGSAYESQTSWRCFHHSGRADLRASLRSVGDPASLRRTTWPVADPVPGSALRPCCLQAFSSSSFIQGCLAWYCELGGKASTFWWILLRAGGIREFAG